MQIHEFIELTARLETYYNKEYSKEQLKIMHEELQNLDIERYKFLISQAIKKCKYLPKVCDLIEIDLENPKKQTQDEEKIYCKKCDSKEYIIYQKNITDGNRILKYDYVALCDCDNGKRNYNKNYPIPFAKELGLI